MIDATEAMRQWLTSSSDLLALVPAARIVAGELPEHANPDAGQQWLTFFARGGPRHPEIKDLINASFGLTCWSRKGDHLGARAIYRAVSDLVYATLNQQVDEGVIIAAIEEVSGQDTTDPGTGWAICVCYIGLLLRPV